MTASNLVYRSLGKGQGAVLGHGYKHPTDGEWDEAFGELRQDILSKTTRHLLVYSAGGAPTSVQRQALVVLSLFHGVQLSIVIEDDADYIDAGGCYVNALNWTGRLDCKAHSPADLEQAAAELEVKDGAALVEAMNEVISELRGKSTSAVA